MPTSTRHLFVALLLVVMGCLAPHTGQAQPADDDPTYDGLDILFLIDQSGSMGGPDFQTEGRADITNDPLGLRFSAPQFSIDWLGNFRAQQSLLENDLDINAAAIYFGGVSNAIRTSDDTLKVPLDWTPIAPDDLRDWQNDRVAPYNALSVDSFGERNLGNTNFVGALEESFDLFQQLNTDRDRLQVILLLTDGEPCAPNLFQRDRNCSNTQDKRDHMTAVRQQVGTDFDEDYQRLYVVAINDGSISQEILDAWEDISGGNLLEITDASQVGITFNRILTELGTRILGDLGDTVSLGNELSFQQYVDGRDSPITTTNAAEFYDVPPYQQVMSVSLFKADPQSELVLTAPGSGGPLLGTADNVIVTGQGTPIEVWRVTNPAPGEWALSTRRVVNGNDVADPGAVSSIDLLRASFGIERPDDTPQMYTPVTVTVAFRNSDGDPLDEADTGSDRLSGELIVMAPGGDDNRYELQPDEDSPGRSVFAATFVPTTDGIYDLEVEASAGSGDSAITLSDRTNINVEATEFQIRLDDDTTLNEGDSLDTLEGVDRHYEVGFSSGASDSGAVGDISVDTFEVALLPAGGVCTEANTASDDNDSPEIIETRHTETGEDQILCMTLTIDDPTRPGQTLTVFDGAYATMDVGMVAPLSLELAQPVRRAAGDDANINLQDRTPRSERQVEPLLSFSPFPWRLQWQPDTVNVEVRVVDADDEPVNLRDGLDDDGQDPSAFLGAQFVNDSGDEFPVDLRASGVDAGVWRGTIDSLPQGRYNLEVEAARNRVGTTNMAFLPGAGSLNYTVELNGNFWLTALEWAIVGGGS
ncbi:MAG: hypothetical protein AAF787_11705 [Chloroflexota bacterium]